MQLHRMYRYACLMLARESLYLAYYCEILHARFIAEIKIPLKIACIEIMNSIVKNQTKVYRLSKLCTSLRACRPIAR